MAEHTPPQAPADSDAAGGPGQMAATDTSAGAGEAEAVAPAETPPPVSVRTLLEVGAHFGHQTQRWNPKMKPYIFGERYGVHIIDLDQTAAQLSDALDFLRHLTASGGRVLFVGTKRQAQISIKNEALRCKQLYVNTRWLGGTLTNFRTVRKSLERYKDLQELFEDEERVGALSKKERSRRSRDLERYRKGLEGLREMTRLPDALFLIDVKREHIAVSEAQRIGIPIAAIVDTNCDPDGIGHVVPANDDATRAISYYCTAAADACLQGAVLREEQIRAQDEGGDGGRAGEARTTPLRRVVEIKPPARRTRDAGRRRGGTGGTRSAGGELAEPQPAAPAPRPTPAGDAGETTD